MTTSAATGHPLGVREHGLLARALEEQIERLHDERTPYASQLEQWAAKHWLATHPDQNLDWHSVNLTAIEDDQVCFAITDTDEDEYVASFTVTYAQLQTAATQTAAAPARTTTTLRPTARSHMAAPSCDSPTTPAGDCDDAALLDALAAGTLTSDTLTREQHRAVRHALEHPDLHQAVARAHDLQTLARLGHWPAGVPTWCAAWAALLSTSPVMVATTLAWPAIGAVLLQHHACPHDSEHDSEHRGPASAGR